MYAIAKFDDARFLGEFVPVSCARGFTHDVYRGGYTLGEGTQMCNLFSPSWNPELHAHCEQVLGCDDLCVVQYEEGESAFAHVPVRLNYGLNGSRFEQKLELV